MTIQLLEDPNSEDIVDGKPYGWWIDEISKVKNIYRCNGANKDYIKRFDEALKIYSILLKKYITIRWAYLYPNKVNIQPKDIPPLNITDITKPEVCKKCGSTMMPLYKHSPRLPNCCFYCGIGPILEASIKDKNSSILKTEHYTLPPPQEYVDKNDSVYVQLSGGISLTKVKGTVAEDLVKEGYQIAHHNGIPLNTDHEAAMLGLLTQQSKEVQRIEGTKSKNEYIIKNKYEIVIECKQLEAFKEGKIKENPENPNTLINAYERALEQHSKSSYNQYPLLIHFWVKYQNRFPIYYRDQILANLIERLPDRIYLIFSIGLLTNRNMCDLYSNKEKYFIHAHEIIHCIEQELDNNYSNDI